MSSVLESKPRWSRPVDSSNVRFAVTNVLDFQEKFLQAAHQLVSDPRFSLLLQRFRFMTNYDMRFFNRNESEKKALTRAVPESLKMHTFGLGGWRREGFLGVSDLDNSFLSHLEDEFGKFAHSTGMGIFAQESLGALAMRSSDLDRPIPLEVISVNSITREIALGLHYYSGNRGRFYI